MPRKSSFGIWDLSTPSFGGIKTHGGMVNLEVGRKNARYRTHSCPNFPSHLQQLIQTPYIPCSSPVLYNHISAVHLFPNHTASDPTRIIGQLRPGASLLHHH